MAVVTAAFTWRLGARAFDAGYLVTECVSMCEETRDQFSSV